MLSHPAHARLALPLLLLGAVAIAFAPIFVRLSDVGPVASAFWRVALALPPLLIWSFSEPPPTPTNRKGGPIALVLAGLCFAGDLAVWHWSLAYTSVANATLLANVAPVFVLLGAWLLWREKPTLKLVGGMVLAMTGALILMGDSFQLSADHLFGDALGLLTAIFYAGYLLAVKQARNQYGTGRLMLVSAAVTALALLPMALTGAGDMIPASWQGWAVLAGLALLSHTGGQSLIAFSLAHLPASFSSITLLVQPATAALLAWVWLNEPLSPWQGMGGIVILAGILLARRSA